MGIDWTDGVVEQQFVCNVVVFCRLHCLAHPKSGLDLKVSVIAGPLIVVGLYYEQLFQAPTRYPHVCFYSDMAYPKAFDGPDRS